MLLKLAWRNVWRNKRRSVITILAVAFAAMLCLAMRGLQIGTYELNIINSVELFSGYLQIQKKGYQERPSLQKSFRFDDKLRELCAQTGHIVAVTPRVLGDGLISFRDQSQGTAIIAVDPQTELQVSTILTKISAGEMFTKPDGDDIVVGYKLLDNLKADIGDTVVVLSQGFDGSLGNLKFRISGTLKTGAQELDRMAIVMGIATAQELLAMYGRINAVAIKLDDVDAIPSVKKSLNNAIAENNLIAMSWNEIMPEMEQAIELDSIGGILFLGILVLIVAFGITNTILMSVTERFREFGVTLAIGMPQLRLLVQVLLETTFIILIGLVLGNLLGLAINAYMVANPITFGGEFADLYAEYGFLPQLKSSLALSIFININLTIFVISLIACIYPLLKVYRLAPLKGIRYT